MEKKKIPIGVDYFRKIIEDNYYYVDKTMLIHDFLDGGDEVTLITRPRRFGKTLNMTMLQEFFDITVDSKKLFAGLKISDTKYMAEMNTKPVIYFSFKGCESNTAEGLLGSLCAVIEPEVSRYYKLARSNKVDFEDSQYWRLETLYHCLRAKEISFDHIKYSLLTLTEVAKSLYDKKPLLLIDEYDTPIMSAYENNYKKQIDTFFSGFLGDALKSNKNLDRAILTGIQRVAKESIFSKLNNPAVYTILDKIYAAHFGLTEKETENLLSYYGIELTEGVRRMYDGYVVDGNNIYNPWSILNYTRNKVLEPYWVNTSSNMMVTKLMSEAPLDFTDAYYKMLEKGEVTVTANLKTAYAERSDSDTLWGLLINTGYITAAQIEYDMGSVYVTAKIPNNEVKRELQRMFAEQARFGISKTNAMLRCLTNGDMNGFTNAYRDIVLSCTSYYDTKENAYHMLFLGMGLTLDNYYSITSNLETGDGRSDIRMESLRQNHPHIIIEFKQGEDTAKLKIQALSQIKEKRYYAGLQGKVLCMGVAHNKKKCDIASEIIDMQLLQYEKRVDQVSTAYYTNKIESGKYENGIEAAEKVAERIPQILSNSEFSLSLEGLISIHNQLFEGIYESAGQLRKYNIYKKEWVLNGDSVQYAEYKYISTFINYVFDREKDVDYGKLELCTRVEKICRFIADIWHVHPFEEGNTRTVVVFAIKYLRTFGYNVSTDVFEQHSFYFRNALVRANDYTRFTTVGYLSRFFGNLLFGEQNELKSRELQIK
ncbi:MAG: AAA family ATPase [Endomicrobium sp.]|jgi:fido (protein-threonine AMPylation protein)|nr:AAA family ATPase [Endomicrobium sp.]